MNPYLMAPTFTLFLVIFLEGYVVLSTELLAIRQIIPFTGSGTDTISIIIAAVLMPLAFGYFAGGRFQAGKTARKRKSIRNKLLKNLTIASLFLCIGLSYSFLLWFFENIYFYFGLNDRIWLTTIYALIFIVYPVYLLGQTVPLISNYFSKERLSELAGKILFFSTLGSFMGAVFCTLVLMAIAGVNYTVMITIGCLVFLALILSKSALNKFTLLTVVALVISFFLNNEAAMRAHNIVENNKYHMIQVEEQEWDGSRHFRINRGNSSATYTDSNEPYFKYASFVENNIIEPLGYDEPKSILVIGAGGFTIGRNDARNQYVFIDIDPKLKETAEKTFLPEKLGEGKTFIAEPARAYLYNTDKKFDLIILDVFKGLSGSPEHLVTYEFFAAVKSRLKENGIVVGNYVLAPNFSDKFSITLDNTIRSVFPHLSRQILPNFNAWDQQGRWVNVVYTMFNTGYGPEVIYTDNRNSSMFDKKSNLELFR
jgi:predicted membrane-bound spermidine synthase